MRKVSRLVAVVLLMACVAAGCARIPKPSSPKPSPAPVAPSVGRQLTIEQAIGVAYKAGFRTEAKLVAIVAIGVAESSLRTNARNWHPEYGLRPAGDRIGVTGPASAWNASHTRQQHSDRGLFQISSHWWPQYSDAQADDPATAARIAFSISRSGTDFSKWDTYKYGSAMEHFDRAYRGWAAVRPKVRAFLASR